MGFTNPRMPWNELEARLSDRRRDGRAPGSSAPNAGGDGPALGRRRQPYEPPSPAAPATPAASQARPSGPPAVELHCHSQFSFLDGVAPPEALAEEAVRLGLEALALTDHHGLYGAVRFAEAARGLGLRTVFGAGITLTAHDAHTRFARTESSTDTQVRERAGPPEPGPQPSPEHLVVLADGPTGYARLARALSLGHLAGEKGRALFSLADLADAAHGVGSGSGTGAAWWVLTGGHSGLVPAALATDGPTAARHHLEQLVDAFGRDRVLVELWHHGDPIDTVRNDALARLAAELDLVCVAANDVRYATPAEHRLATAVAAVRSRRSLDAADPWLAASPCAHLRSSAEQRRRFARYPGVVDAAVDIARAAAFDLSLVAPRLPPFPCPDGLDEMGYLRHLVAEGARRRYGERPTTSTEDLSLRSRAWRTIDHELAIIEQLGFAGYFLVVWDIVRFCERADIYCQGRGSAANSAVCYALGVTKADAVSLGLLFERFLSPERDGPPDIDLDIESGRREEVIQYVFGRYGRHHAAQVANVITYRARSAVRDMGRALGHPPARLDTWSREIDAWSGLSATVARDDHDIPDDVLGLAVQLEDAPRHLGIHSGGMVICDRPVIEVCPVEWARMERRSVLQWDKDDCAAAGLVKFDLLGLGMLTALHRAVDLVAQYEGAQIDLATIPQEDEVYAMLCRADSVGVFQVESRAQMATLPRLAPRRFYDLVVEVALIRPGPIQGGSVHPYIRRRNGKEPVTYLHPLLENSLGKTLGVPLFQEQLMQMAIDVAGFTPAEADELRQAMGSKRSRRRMERLRARLYDGMAERGIVGEVADAIFDKMAAFANYGFPESHSVSFAYLVYASAWLKYHHPAAFCAALLDAQPMGFWSPHTIVRDARRHGVVVHTPDIAASGAGAELEADTSSLHGWAVRLGLSSVRGIGRPLADRIVAERSAAGPYTSMEDLVRRVPELTLAHLEAFATAGAFGDGLGLDRRSALWQAGAAVQSRPDRLPGIVTGAVAPRLPGMAPVEEAVADLWATGISPDGHPTVFLRERLDVLGVVPADRLVCGEPGSKVVVAGVVTHRQRPMTAQGTTFLNLEDETGLINVVVSKGCWIRFRRVATGASALMVRGRLERSEGVVNIVAEHLAPLGVPGALVSRDFR
jgi:error-prone DNA polymerase